MQASTPQCMHQTSRVKPAALPDQLRDAGRCKSCMQTAALSRVMLQERGSAPDAAVERRCHLLQVHAAEGRAVLHQRLGADLPAQRQHGGSRATQHTRLSQQGCCVSEKGVFFVQTGPNPAAQRFALVKIALHEGRQCNSRATPHTSLTQQSSGAALCACHLRRCNNAWQQEPPSLHGHETAVQEHGKPARQFDTAGRAHV